MFDIETLCTKREMPSFLPTPAEVLDGVRWLRENPAIAAGIVVGLTSYSIAKYYEHGENRNEENNDCNGDHAENDRSTRDEIARSTTTLHLGRLETIDTVKKDSRFSAANSSASTESSRGSLGELRLNSSFIFNKAYHEKVLYQNHSDEQVWSCLHGGKCPPGELCCDPVWGWSVSGPDSA